MFGLEINVCIGAVHKSFSLLNGLREQEINLNNLCKQNKITLQGSCTNDVDLEQFVGKFLFGR